MATTIVEHLQARARWEELIAVCDVVLQRYPRLGWMIVAQASAYGRLLHREFEQKFPVPFLIPEHLRARRLMLMERNHSLFQAAEALGWEPVEYDGYLEQERQKACS